MSRNVSGVLDAWRSSWRDTDTPAIAYRHGVEGVPEQEPDERHARALRARRAGELHGPACGRQAQAHHSGEEQLRQAEQADPDDLPGQERPRLDRREQHLHHPRRLLLHHPGGHREAEDDELPVEQQRRRERDSRSCRRRRPAPALCVLSGGGSSARRTSSRSRPSPRSDSTDRTWRAATCRSCASSSGGSSSARSAPHPPPPRPPPRRGRRRGPEPRSRTRVRRTRTSNWRSSERAVRTIADDSAP